MIPVRAERGAVRLSAEHEPSRGFTHVWVAAKLPVPAILHVCRESRAIGLKHYELVFDSNPRPAKEDMLALQNLPPLRGVERAIFFPYETKAMVYVDLERDIIVTSHRWLEHWTPAGGWPQDGPELGLWPVRPWPFNIDIFRQVVPRQVYSRIRTLAATFTFTITEIFSVSPRRRPLTHRHVLVIKDPFRITDSGEDYIDGLCRSMVIPGPEYKGRLRSLTNLQELADVIRDETLWDWAASKDSDEGRVSFLPVQGSMGPRRDPRRSPPIIEGPY